MHKDPRRPESFCVFRMSEGIYCEQTGNISVTIRFRPLFHREIQEGHDYAWEIIDNCVQLAPNHKLRSAVNSQFSFGSPLWKNSFVR
jgi:hypothetical protein